MVRQTTDIRLPHMAVVSDLHLEAGQNSLHARQEFAVEAADPCGKVCSRIVSKTRYKRNLGSP